MKIDNVRYEKQCESEVTWIAVKRDLVPIKVDNKSLRDKLGIKQEEWPITFLEEFNNPIIPKGLRLDRHVTDKDINAIQYELGKIANDPLAGLTTSHVFEYTTLTTAAVQEWAAELLDFIL